MVNFYILNRLLKTSTYSTRPWKAWGQRVASPKTNEQVESIKKSKVPHTHYFHRAASKNHFIMLCCYIAAIFVLSFSPTNSALSEEKDNNTSDALRFSIIGDQEAPSVRYFVPWKSPELDEMLPLPMPDLQPLQILDPHELRREIDYYSTLYPPAMGNIKENAQAPLSGTKTHEIEMIEGEPTNPMPTSPQSIR